MATREVTLSLPTEIADEIESLVRDGQVRDLSRFATETFRVHLERLQWVLLLRKYTGGPPSEETQAWADGVLGIGPEVPPPDRGGRGGAEGGRRAS